jgi:hypothetical protein
MNMRITFGIITTSLSIAACSALPEIETPLAEAPAKCITREAATGSNYLTRTPCAKDSGEHRDAHEQAEAIRDDQRYRELSKMKRGS